MEEKPPPTSDLRSRTRRIARPVFAFAGVAYIVAAIAKLMMHQDFWPLYFVCAAGFFVLAWVSKPGKPGTS